MLIDVKATAAYNSGGQRTTRPLMLHRHLNHQAFTLAAIEDVIARGHWEDWAALRQAILCDPSLLCKVERVCHPSVLERSHLRWRRSGARRSRKFFYCAFVRNLREIASEYHTPSRKGAVGIPVL